MFLQRVLRKYHYWCLRPCDINPNKRRDFANRGSFG